MPVPPDPGVRLDVWLDVACLFKTRSDAQRGITGGKVEVNGQVSKPHRILHRGDQLRITRPGGRKQLVLVKEVAEQHVPKAEARLLYEDVTPPPTPEEQAMRELERFFRKSQPRLPARAPTRDERRLRRRIKEGDGEPL